MGTTKPHGGVVVRTKGKSRDQGGDPEGWG